VSALATTRAGETIAAKGAASPSTPVHNTDKQQREIDEKLLIVGVMKLKIMLQGKSRDAAAKEVESEGIASRGTALRAWELRDNPNALARKTRIDRDKSKWFEAHPKAKKFVIAKYLENPNISYVSDCLDRYLPQGEDLPSRNTIRAFIEREVPKPHFAAMRQSKQKWNATYAPYLVTGRGAFTPANQTLSGDHRQLDILCTDDRAWAEKPGAALRAWLTILQDARTRLIAASLVTVQPDCMVLATAMRMAISQFGKPELCYFDNGKDFRKLAATLERIGIAVQYCTPRHPQAKFVESTFSFFSKRFDPLFFHHGYTGSRPELRSEFCRDQERQHKGFLAGTRRETPLYPLSFVSQLIQQWVREYNCGHHHSGRGMDGRTPMEVMNELLPVAQRKIPDMAALEPLFWDEQIRTALRGKVQLNNFTYSPALDDAEGQVRMYEVGGTDIAVRRDPNDMAFALAFENRPSGRLLARLVCDELAAQRPYTHEEITAMMHQRAKLYKTSKQAMDAFTAEVPSEIELLARRAGIQPESPALIKPRRIAQHTAVPESAEDFVERLRLRKAQ
jgi:hypothetical protein